MTTRIIPPDPHPQPWLTEDLRALLAAIRPPHVEKKRRTVILLAFARANQTPVADVFGREDTCHISVWYEKWARDPAIHAAYDACYARALEYADEETASLEAHYTRKRRHAIAQYSADAPIALASVMTSQSQRGADRINAALSLIKLADPETRDVPGPAPAAGDVTQEVTVDAAGRLDDLLMRALYPQPEPPPDAADANPGGDAA